MVIRSGLQSGVGSARASREEFRVDVFASACHSGDAEPSGRLRGYCIGDRLGPASLPRKTCPDSACPNSSGAEPVDAESATGRPPDFKVEVIETTPLPGLDLKLEQIPAPVQTAVERRNRGERRARPLRLPEPPLQRRLRQRDAGQPVSAGSQLPRLHRVAAARHAAGAVDLHGRRAAEPAVRRRRQLGSDSPHGHRVRRR